MSPRPRAVPAIVRPPMKSQIQASKEPCSAASARNARAFPIADLIFIRLRTIPACFIRRSTSRAPKRATAAGSKPRKASR
jgi:hypothetical protein